ncbi:MAG: RluA family pseudouridine synthase [Epsilonproteobacteria bacterium]|nr:RluA family pseudouridine synthase [Campylobacterota bacterium]
MAFGTIDIFLEKETRPFRVVMDMLGCPMREAQRYIDKQRLFCENKIVSDKSIPIKGKISLVVFKPVTKGLKPTFQGKDFAVFDKPSGLLVHPKNRNTSYSLTDEVKYHFGNDANIVHRIDKETSGLVLAAKNRETEILFKDYFQKKYIKKGYLSIVKGKLQNELWIDEPISTNRDYSSVKIKVKIDKNGKKAQTFIKPIRFIPKLNATLVEAIPITGRQHQIRIHLFHVKHPIIGDPIYGTSYQVASDYLDGKLDTQERIAYTGADRLLLHAHWIEFKHDNRYKLYVKSFYEVEFGGKKIKEYL